MNKDDLSRLPKVDLLLMATELEEVVRYYGRSLVKESAQAEINRRRQSIIEGNESLDLSLRSFIGPVKERCRQTQEPYLRSVINATGVVLHTNLGRAQLPPMIQKQLAEISFGYSNLEYDLEKGSRGSRYQHLEADLLKLTGAEAGLVVNNNAAAVLLALQTFIQGKEIIISRGELVEIGGSFRIPDIIALSGGIIREVGTTNKTHLRDYEQAINENTGAILKVHTSNYKVIGFTETVPMEELVKLGSSHHIPVMNDLGSGLLTDLTPFGFPYEPTVMDCVQAGCDIITFSGDKLLGGPQAGLIVGKKTYIDQMKANQLTRALRVDKMTLSALELTLKEYLKPESLLTNIPTLHLLSLSKEEIEKRGADLKQTLEALNLPLEISVVEGLSQVGGGSYPGVQLPTRLVTLKSLNLTADKLEKALRDSQTPIIARIKDDQVQLDVRTINEVEVPLIASALTMIFT
ncbi:L-seryl-tRNA(Sec) selenium transferase [uncultured Vagococcus sp.]|uniref:L-seryl-tRNA(Sec) selenium transferase n=1 Tax=uncultured Vagococcus sp. TaxID=189676 RepID=UPI0028D53E62|nr:L-seryl-tRNA(Sec) selenium transferase [uncultured Vagococcus sp.]